MNTMSVDALAPWVDRTSAAIVVIVQDRRVPVFHEKNTYTIAELRNTEAS